MGFEPMTPACKPWNCRQSKTPIMKEEVFGPILPVLEIDLVQGVIDWVNASPHPLGPYHSPRIDPGVRYPPYSEHQRERAVEFWVT
jgi:hypothetical protein